MIVLEIWEKRSGQRCVYAPLLCYQDPATLSAERRRFLTVLPYTFAMVGLCAEGKFLEAQNKYTELAIGNASWPFGVSNIGIHQRAGWNKIRAGNNIAHVLTDEPTRRYLHSFKRLMTFTEIYLGDEEPERDLLRSYRSMM